MLIFPSITVWRSVPGESRIFESLIFAHTSSLTLAECSLILWASISHKIEGVVKSIFGEALVVIGKLTFRYSISFRSFDSTTFCARYAIAFAACAYSSGEGV